MAKAKQEVSQRFKILKQDLWSMLRGLLDVCVGAGALYLADQLAMLDMTDLGVMAPAVTAVLVVVAKSLRKWASETTYAK